MNGAGRCPRPLNLPSAHPAGRPCRQRPPTTEFIRHFLLHLRPTGGAAHPPLRRAGQRLQEDPAGQSAPGPEPVGTQREGAGISPGLHGAGDAHRDRHLSAVQGAAARGDHVGGTEAPAGTGLPSRCAGAAAAASTAMSATRRPQTTQSPARQRQPPAAGPACVRGAGASPGTATRALCRHRSQPRQARLHLPGGFPTQPGWP
jgi:hypothetical protein